MANLSYPAQKKHKVEFGMKHFPFDSLAGFAGENQMGPFPVKKSSRNLNFVC